MAKTNNLDLEIITDNSVFSVAKIDENSEKIDATFGAKLSTLLTTAKTIIGSINELFTNKLDKGTGLKATNARQLEEQMENLFEYGSNANGYWEKNNATGIIKQYGKSIAFTGALAVNYPIPFLTEVFNIQATNADVTGAPLSRIYLETPQPLDNFTIVKTSVEGGSDVIYWTATGR